MAPNTPRCYQNLVIYEVYVRNHGPHGNFGDVTADLERIRALGVDIVWFMPIHPIGKAGRKGSLGSPYSIADYREVNPEYGTKEDFSHLIEKAHRLGMKVMIDVVYNHTAQDSNLVQDHPEYYHLDSAGKPFTTVPEWSDVIDLNYSDPGLDEYLIESLIGWLKFGVDGFRCDVASLIPPRFWAKARARCAEVNPETIWLAESVHTSFILDRRQAGLSAFSDSELYATCFDLTYDYDIWPIFQAAVVGKEPVHRYLEILRFQTCIYPGNYVKMRCVENHDQARILGLAPSRAQALAWTAFEAFNHGAFLIYAGQESAAVHTPNLFEIDRVPWGNFELSTFLTRLAQLKKDPIVQSGNFTIFEAEPITAAVWESQAGNLLGLFNLSGSKQTTISVPLPDGDYSDQLNGGALKVENGQTQTPETASILQYPRSLHPRWFYSTLLDFHIHRDSP